MTSQDLSKPTVTPAPISARVAWLDQFRGYTVLGMFVVNFLGGFAVVPAWLKHHHTYCSYADTIMPQFLFAVGVGYRLTFRRRLERGGWWAAIGHAFSRNLGLLLVAFLVYHAGKGVRTWSELTGPELWPALAAGLKRDFFQTLTHIAVASLWVLPVIGLGTGPRAAWLILSAALHLIASHLGYYEWVNASPKGIDGGPLGFLTWTIPLLVGTFAADALLTDRPRTRTMLALAVALMLVGYGLSCLNRVTPPNDPVASIADLFVEPPFLPPAKEVNLWTMSQRSGSLTYLAFGAGFALLVALGFLALEQRTGWTWSVFTTPGRNALAGYLIHDVVDEAISPYLPWDAPLGFALAGLLVYLLICWVILRHLEKQKLFLKL